MRKMICDWQERFKRRAICVLLGVFFCMNVVAQGKHFSWDFVDCDLRDILFAVSMDTGISIVPDDTVVGKGDFRFAGENFQDAFESFLLGNRLFVERKENVWKVSKFSMRKENGLYSVDACDLQPSQIIEKLSERVDCVFTFDTLPMQKYSIHFKKLTLADLVDSIAKSFGTYEVTKLDSGYHFVKSTENKKNNYFDGNVKIEFQENKFLLDLRQCSFSDAVEKLFSIEKRNGGDVSFCLLSNGDVKLQRALFYGNDFKDSLEKLCSQAGFSFINENNLYYIYSDLNSRNELITGKRDWNRFSLCYTKAQDFIPLLLKKIDQVETVTLPDEFSFLCRVSEKECEIINQLIEIVDIKKSTYLINLKYIRPKEFLEYLPPSIDKSSLYIGDENECLYFKGTEAAYKSICEQLSFCDRPVKRISYDLLILQYDETKQNSWNSTFDAKRLTAGNRNGVSAMLGSVLSLNMNVISAFGLSFAAELQSSIEENTTKVFADTTLHGISGKQINFQNTNTFRYRDNNVNPETGIPLYSGITKEITSGIKLDVLGWVSGDGMVTSKVTASISRQGIDTSASTGNPPPTSEKIVTTEVCGKSGEPVVLSGLIQQSDDNQEKGTPLISKLPVIGNLFKNKGINQEKTQMVIYLVPHIDEENEKNELNNRFDEKWKDEKISVLEKLKVGADEGKL